MNLADYLNQTAPAAAASNGTAASAVSDPVWQALEPLDMLPNGQPLRCTLRRTLIMADVFGADEAPFPAVLSIAFLYLCAHDATTWSVPTAVGPREMRPLWRAPEQLLEAAFVWAETALPHLTPAEVTNLATRLWLWNDETRVTPQKKIPGTGMTTPAESIPPPQNSGSSSLPPAMPQGGTGSSTIFPCETSIPPSTPGS